MGFVNDHSTACAGYVLRMSFWQREHEREIQALKETYETLNAAKEKGLAEKSQDVARLQVSTMVDGHKTNGTNI